MAAEHVRLLNPHCYPNTYTRTHTHMHRTQEECGVDASLVGVVSLRHTHGVRFGQGDLYVIVKLKSNDPDAKIVVDKHELGDAQWMSVETIKALVETNPKVRVRA